MLLLDAILIQPESTNFLFHLHAKWRTRKVTIVTIAIATAGVVWMIAEEVSIALYLNSPCPNEMPCDKVVGRGQVPAGTELVIAAAIIYIAGRIIWPSKAATTSTVN
jgi:hypothetical protein